MSHIVRRGSLGLLSRVWGALAGVMTVVLGLVASPTLGATVPAGLATADLEDYPSYYGRVVRWDGADRYVVSANISKTNFDPGVGTVYIANGLASADALAAGPVAGASQSPILLVRKDSVPSAVADELDRLNPAKIVVLGGTGSVSATVETKLKAYTNSVVRWAGADRYVVSANISATNFPAGTPTVYVANGLASADALAAGPVAGMSESPILLVKTDSVPSSVAAELGRLNPTEIVILGGTGSVSPGVESWLRVRAESVTRWAGQDRYEVSANISARNFPDGAPTVYVANGLASADALAAGPVASMTESPILLVRQDSIPLSVADELVRLAPGRVVILGGTGSVSGPANYYRTVEYQILHELLLPNAILVSAAPDGGPGIDGSFRPAISADGRFITYASDAWNLTPGDLNGFPDVFLWDRQTRTTAWVAPYLTGIGIDTAPSISPDGRYVFYSTKGKLWDRVTGTMIDAPPYAVDVSFSADGHYIAYSTETRARVWDTATGSYTSLSDSVDFSYNPRISADGRYIAYIQDDCDGGCFYGGTRDLAKGNVMLWDRETGESTLVSSGLDGATANGDSYSAEISADGRYVAFASKATNLVIGGTGLYIWDRQTDTLTTVADGQASYWISLSADGRYLAYEGFYGPAVLDRVRGTTISVDPYWDRWHSGSSGVDISTDGKFVTYASAGQVYVVRNPVFE